jgi:hypothetical protein
MLALLCDLLGVVVRLKGRILRFAPQMRRNHNAKTFVITGLLFACSVPCSAQQVGLPVIQSCGSFDSALTYSALTQSAVSDSRLVASVAVRGGKIKDLRLLQDAVNMRVLSSQLNRELGLTITHFISSDVLTLPAASNFKVLANGDVGSVCLVVAGVSNLALEKTSLGSASSNSTAISVSLGSATGDNPELSLTSVVFADDPGTVVGAAGALNTSCAPQLCIAQELRTISTPGIGTVALTAANSVRSEAISVRIARDTIFANGLE